MSDMSVDIFFFLLFKMVIEGFLREQLFYIYELMFEGWVFEECLICMQCQGDGYFWIGGFGEEVFNICFGLQVKKGYGFEYDYLYFYYCSSGMLFVMGVLLIDVFCQMYNVKIDFYLQGCNFVGYFSKCEWNVVLIILLIEVQYLVVIGMVMVQWCYGGDGIIIVQGGDVGMVEGDFVICFVWFVWFGEELFILIIVVNNEWGIFILVSMQYGEKYIFDCGKVFGMCIVVCNGNDFEEVWYVIQDVMEYVCCEWKFFVFEVQFLCFYGYSLLLGLNYVDGEMDCFVEIEKKFVQNGWCIEEEFCQMCEWIEVDMQVWYKQVKGELKLSFEDVFDYVFVDKNIVGGEV